MPQSLDVNLCVPTQHGGPYWVKTIGGEAYWALWEGHPPIPLLRDIPGVARVQLRGEFGGNPVYGERIPPGRPLTECELSSTLERLVSEEVARILTELHQVPAVFGELTRANLYIAMDGAVWLVGRGRTPWPLKLDLEASDVLFERTENADYGGRLRDTEITDEVSPHTLREWMEQNGVPMTPSGTTWSIALKTVNSEGLDEIIPDFGTDAGNGLMDNWTRSDSGWEHTVERTDVGIRNAEHQVLVELWSRMTVGLGEALPSHRFDAVQGHPSKGIRTLIQNEWPVALPMRFIEASEANPTPSDDPEFELKPGRISDSLGLILLFSLVALLSASILASIGVWIFFL